MRVTIYIAAALLAVATLYVSGFLSAINLLHPFWKFNATLFGSAAGAVLAVLIFWALRAKPRLGRWLSRGAMLGFAIALPVTLLSATIFIDAAEYHRVAVELWHKGSYAVFILFVPSAATVLAKLTKDKAT